MWGLDRATWPHDVKGAGCASRSTAVVESACGTHRSNLGLENRWVGVQLGLASGLDLVHSGMSIVAILTVAGIAEALGCKAFAVPVGMPEVSGAWNGRSRASALGVPGFY